LTNHGAEVPHPAAAVAASTLPEDGEGQRDRVDAVARSWLGTAYHNHGEVKGAGCDCATLLKCVYVEAGMIPPFDIGYYAPQHFLHQDEERYLGWVKRFAHEVPPEAVRHGDIALYWIARCYAHGAIVVKPGWPRIIHAHFASRCVREGLGTAVRLGTPVKGVKFFSMWD
jgi:hypothetical protein